MTGDDRRRSTSCEEVRVPDPLVERLEERFVAERGYEPASFQEALSYVLDATEPLASGEGRPAVGQPAGTTGRSTDSTGNGFAGRLPGGEADETPPDAADDAAVDAESVTSTDDGASEGSSGTFDPTTVSVEQDDVDSVSFDAYVDGLEASDEDEPGPAVESLLDTEHADGVVRELAAEVLDEMTQDAFAELEHGVDEGVAGVTDGNGGAQADSGGETAPSGTTGDGVPDSLTADPESDCAICGRAHRVSVLQTTILDEDGGVALVCPACSG